MESTPRALSLAGPVRLALQDIQTGLAPDRFEPAEIGLTIAVETHETIVVLPLLVEEIRREAPGAVLMVRSGSMEDILHGLDQGRVDVAPERRRLMGTLTLICSMRVGLSLGSVCEQQLVRCNRKFTDAPACGVVHGICYGGAETLANGIGRSTIAVAV